MFAHRGHNTRKTYKNVLIQYPNSKVDFCRIQVMIKFHLVRN